MSLRTSEMSSGLSVSIPTMTCQPCASQSFRICPARASVSTCTTAGRFLVPSFAISVLSHSSERRRLGALSSVASDGLFGGAFMKFSIRTRDIPLATVAFSYLYFTLVREVQKRNAALPILWDDRFPELATTRVPSSHRATVGQAK